MAVPTEKELSVQNIDLWPSGLNRTVCRLSFVELWGSAIGCLAGAVGGISLFLGGQVEGAIYSPLPSVPATAALWCTSFRT